MEHIRPLVTQTGSDSFSLDNMLEVLMAGGMDIFRAMRILIPRAWQNTTNMDAELRAFYEYHSMHMEPWDGPAGIVLTDGRYAACSMDRNGLRPGLLRQVDDLGGRAVTGDLGQGFELHPGRRFDPIGHHPATDPPAVQLDPHHGPHPHRGGVDAVRYEVVELLVDGGNVGKDPNDPGTDQSPRADLRASTRSVFSQVKPSPSERPKWP